MFKGKRFLLAFISLFMFFMLVGCDVNTTNNNDSMSNTSDSTSTIDKNQDQFNDNEDKYYNITFRNDNGEILSSNMYKEGSMPSYNDTPLRESTAEYTYTFRGWNPSITSVTKDCEYIATYTATKNKYTYTFFDEDGDTPLKEDTINYGELIVPPTNPSKSSDSQYTYEFDGWYTAKTGGTKVEELGIISNNISYYARYKNTTNKYTVTWKNWNGEVLETDTNVEYGTMPSYNGNTPVKSSDQNNQYVFEKWDK